jgi:Tetratrico peptide repeat
MSMTTNVPDWEQRVSELWASYNHRTEADFLAAMKELVAELPASDPIGLFEHAAALDSTGREREAVALALTALSRHLTRYQRSLRNYARALVDGGTPG